MPRQKIGNKQTLGISLNDGIDQDADILAAIRASGQSPSQAIRAALIVWMRSGQEDAAQELEANGVQLDSEVKNILTSQSAEINAMRRQIGELVSLVGKLVTAGVIQVASSPVDGGSVIAYDSSDGSVTPTQRRIEYAPVDATFAEAVKKSAQGRKPMRLDDNGDIVQ